MKGEQNNYTQEVVNELLSTISQNIPASETDPSLMSIMKPVKS